MIDAGKYNRKIQIVADTVTKDAQGFVVVTPVVKLSPYAEVKTTKGMTLIANGSDFDKAFTRFTIRKPATTEITRKMFVLFNGKKYSIEYINNIDEQTLSLSSSAKR